VALDPRARRLLDLLAASAQAPSRPETAEQRRSGLCQLATLAADRAPPAVKATEMVIPGGDGAPLRLRGYRPPAQAGGPGGLIVYVHGGGWVGGDLETHDGVCRSASATALGSKPSCFSACVLSLKVSVASSALTTRRKMGRA